MVMLDNEVTKTWRSYIGSLLLMVGAIGLFPCVNICVFKLTQKLQEFSKNLHTKTLQLERERERGLGLLYQMLPPSVARKLMRNEVILPRLYGAVTLYFSDIVGFTTICSKRTPMEVIDMLNRIYKAFDNRLEKYDAFKVETIGNYNHSNNYNFV